MSTENQSVCAVVVAAGSSRRMGGENKLLLPLCGKPVLAHTLMAFQMCGAVRDIVLVCREQDMEVYRTLAAENGITKLRTLTRGGDTRTESVLAGVSAASEACALVAVHDGARPLVSDEVITQAVDEAAKTGAAAPVVPVKDSIKRIENGKIAADVPRDTLAAVQTPQVFRRELLLDALQSAAAMCLRRRMTYIRLTCLSMPDGLRPVVALLLLYWRFFPDMRAPTAAALRMTAPQWRHSVRRFPRPRAATKTSRLQRPRTLLSRRRSCTGGKRNEYADRTRL